MLILMLKCCERKTLKSSLSDRAIVLSLSILPTSHFLSTYCYIAQDADFNYCSSAFYDFSEETSLSREFDQWILSLK